MSIAAGCGVSNGNGGEQIVAIRNLVERTNAAEADRERRVESTLCLMEFSASCPIPKFALQIHRTRTGMRTRWSEQSYQSAGNRRTSLPQRSGPALVAVVAAAGSHATTVSNFTEK